MEKAIKKYWPIFVLPTLAAFIIGFIIPFLQGAYLAFCQFTTVRDATFIGISNFISALRDATFTPRPSGTTAPSWWSARWPSTSAAWLWR